MSTKSNSHLLGGFLGGLASAVALQPLDLLKTRVQQGNRSLTQTLRELESLSSLWRGTTASALRTSVGSALYLTTLNIFRTALASPASSTDSKATGQGTKSSSVLPKLSTPLNLATGFVARALVGLLTMPITIIKVRFESTVYHYTSLTSAVRDIWATEGMRGFVRGSSATIARDAPYAGLYVGLYEWWKTTLTSMNAGRDEDLSAPGSERRLSISTSAVINSSSALVSASLATIITAPFDTIKTRMQLEPKKYASFTGTALSIASGEGVKGLLGGVGLRLVRKAGSAGVAWGIYEEIVRWRGQQSASTVAQATVLK